MKVFTRWSDKFAIKQVIEFENLLRSRSTDMLVIADSDLIKTIANRISNRRITRWNQKALIKFDDLMEVNGITTKPFNDNYNLKGENIFYGDINIFLFIANIEDGYNETIFNDYITTNNIIPVVEDIDIGLINTQLIDDFLNIKRC